MKIYKSEKEAGLAARIRTSSSVAYLAQLQPLDPATPLAQKLVKAIASEDHPSDTLYPLKDILVTTGCNINKDVFDCGETWVARNTPLHHPLNFQHDEKRIIGTITASQAVAADLTTITPLPDDLAVDELPDKFHILNGSVIYRVWQDAEQQKLIDRTIAEIERGEWYVSMECIFGGFDYAVWGPDGQTRVVARNEESAFLTKHLRQYGGAGYYKCPETGAEFQLGRLFRGIRFVGKGLVRQPANPESIIFNNVSAFVSSSANLEYIKAEATVTSPPESKIMSESNADIKKLEDRVAELVRENQSLATQLKERDGQAVKAEIDGLKNEVTTREQKVQVLEAKVEELAKSVAALTKRAEDADAAKANVEGELATLKAEKVQQSRLALLTSKGASSEKAAELLQKFQRFSDEEFASIVDTLAVAWKAPAQTTTPVRKTPEQVIDNTANNTPHDPALAASEPNEEEKAQARIAKASRLFTKNFLHHSVVSDKE